MQARGWNHVVLLPSRFFHSVCLVIDLIRDFPVGTFLRRVSSAGPADSFLAEREVPIIMIDPSAFRRVTNMLAAGRFAMHGAVGRVLGGWFGVTAQLLQLTGSPSENSDAGGSDCGSCGRRAVPLPRAPAVINHSTSPARRQRSAEPQSTRRSGS